MMKMIIKNALKLCSFDGVRYFEDFVFLEKKLPIIFELSPRVIDFAALVDRISFVNGVANGMESAIIPRRVPVALQFALRFAR